MNLSKISSFIEQISRDRKRFVGLGEEDGGQLEAFAASAADEQVDGEHVVDGRRRHTRHQRRRQDTRSAVLGHRRARHSPGRSL